MNVVYFSTKSGNTRRFVEKLTDQAQRIPLEARATPLKIDAPFVLIFPSYGGGHAKGAVPPQVIRFLNDPENRAHLKGVVGTGNTSFGAGFCLGARIVAHKCQVPLLHTVELFGTPDDVETVYKDIFRDGHESQSQVA